MMEVCDCIINEHEEDIEVFESLAAVRYQLSPLVNIEIDIRILQKLTYRQEGMIPRIFHHPHLLAR